MLMVESGSGSGCNGVLYVLMVVMVEKN